ncbi:MAG: response regulator transcription factor [Chloroflexi bacterium]|nr:response regulator transcription factor [Chloroflexota bacterium]
MTTTMKMDDLERAAAGRSTPAGRVTVLLVEDDPEIVDLLTEVLEPRGYHLVHAATAEQATSLLSGAPAAEAADGASSSRSAPPDLVILDLGLPDEDGLVLCSNLKARRNVPIIICSATTERRDRILGLRLGADDFITKPFDSEELVARIEAVLRRGNTPPPARRAAAPDSPRYEQLGALRLDRSTLQAELGGAPLHLTPIQYRLLLALMGRPGEVCSKEDLARLIWGHYDDALRQAIDVHVFRLRDRLKTGPVPAPRIIAVRGVGYRIEA